MSYDDEKFNEGGSGTITDDNYTDPYSGTDDDVPPTITDQEDETTLEDIENEEKGEPDDNEYIPILERNAPFTEDEAEALEEAKKLRTLKGLAIIGGLLWLS